MEKQGEILRKMVKRSDLTAIEIAKRMEISRDTLYELFKKEKLDDWYIEKLKKLGLNLTDKTLQLQNAVPVYDVEAIAGYARILTFDQSENVIGYIDLPDVTGAKAIIRVKGDSMADKYMPNSFVGVKEVLDSSIILYGHVYGILTDEIFFLKYIRKAKDDKKNYLLRSHNKNYEDFEIPKSKVKKLFLVTHEIKIEPLIHVI